MAHNTFLLITALGFKARGSPPMFYLLPAHNKFHRPTCAMPADLLVANTRN